MNPVPGPPPSARPDLSAQATPAHALPAAETSAPEPLDEARRRLAALDELPLHEHPGEFAAIDGLLRQALDAAGAGR